MPRNTPSARVPGEEVPPLPVSAKEGKAVRETVGIPHGVAKWADRWKRKPELERAEADVLHRAIQVIGNRSEAMRWMGTPVRALDYATPVSRLATAAGRKAVRATLDRLEHGVL